MLNLLILIIGLYLILRWVLQRLLTGPFGFIGRGIRMAGRALSGILFINQFKRRGCLFLIFHLGVVLCIIATLAVITEGTGYLSLGVLWALVLLYRRLLNTITKLKQSRHRMPTRR